MKRVQVKGKDVRQGGLTKYLNRKIGVMATFYMTYRDNKEWNAKIFRGNIVSASNGLVVLSDPATGMQYILRYRNLDYITFD
ncbi:spore coat protein GerQ [Paenibacillus sp. NPDC058071]|uniref:spore coat protein GerQ n=1 Tax=Paenibacillus sp. NPDC058071 TaxID=3346326 RepID=UPI0036D796E8